MDRRLPRTENRGTGVVNTQPPQSSEELAAFVAQLLTQVVSPQWSPSVDTRRGERAHSYCSRQHSCFDSMSSSLLTRIDDMGARVEELENGAQRRGTTNWVDPHATLFSSQQSRSCLTTEETSAAGMQGCKQLRQLSRQTLPQQKTRPN